MDYYTLDDIKGMGAGAAPAGGQSFTLSDIAAMSAPKAKLPPARSADYEAGRNDPSALSGVKRGLLSVLNGPTFGFGDEIAGAVGGAIDSLKPGGKFAQIGDNYRANRDFARGAQDLERETNPWTTGITQMAASAPMGAMKLFSAGATAVPMGMAGQMGRGAATGGVYGALSGAGNSTADDLGGVGMDALKGGALGASLGGAAVPLGRVAGAAGGNIAQRVSENAAAKYAKEKIAEAFSRDGRGAVVQAGLSNPIMQAEARLGKLGDAAVLADSGGVATRGLLDTMATLPGATKDAAERMIRDRQAGSASRLIGAANKSLGTNGDRLAGTVDDLVTMRATASEPLYQQIGQTTIAQPSAALRAAVAAADELGATRIGQQMSTARQVPYTLDTQNPSGWAMRDLDHVKQGMDQLIAKQWDAVNGKLTPLGASYQQLKDRLVGELDSATINPATGASLYKSARDAFAGPSALIDAARAGQSSISKNEAAISQLTAKFSTSEQEAFKVGAFEALREKLGRSDAGRTEVLNMWKNPATRDRLQAMFGSESAFRSFAAETAKESRLKLLESTGRGSQTAARQYAAGDLDVPAMREAGQALGSAASGNIPGMLTSVAGAWNRVKTPEAVRDQMGKMLLSGGADARGNLFNLRDFTARINGDRALWANEAGLLGNPSGSLIGGGLLGN